MEAGTRTVRYQNCYFSICYQVRGRGTNWRAVDTRWHTMDDVVDSLGVRKGDSWINAYRRGAWG